MRYLLIIFFLACQNAKPKPPEKTVKTVNWDSLKIHAWDSVIISGASGITWTITPPELDADTIYIKIHDTVYIMVAPEPMPIPDYPHVEIQMDTVELIPM